MAPGISSQAKVARRLVERFGGRFSTEMGIDLDGDGEQIDRWFLAATLFGTRISTPIVVRTYRTLAAGGVWGIGDVASRSWDELVRLLDEGGYARYDFRTATRLQDLAAEVAHRHGEVATLARIGDPDELEATLQALPGWGPVTTRLFLRELRGVWPGAEPAMDERSLAAARHLALLEAEQPYPMGGLRELARPALVDPRDLEAALVRLGLAHGREYASCAGGGSCSALHAD